jgi:LruC domain-containing protein
MMAVVAIGLMLAVTSCNKNFFVKEDYVEYTRGLYPVDTLDETHDWNLVQRMRLRVSADVKIADMARLQILSANPYYDGSAEVLAEETVSYGDEKWLIVEAPITQQHLYAAIVTTSGNYHVREFPVGQQNVKFSNGTIVSEGNMLEPGYQTFTYLFEETFPIPSDFDYNDVVLRISKSVPAPNVLKLRVRLVAVGASGTLAGAIRLPGIAYKDVESVTIDEGKPLDDGYPLMRSRLLGGANFGEGNGGDAVINLFEDAHWCMNPETDEMGIISAVNYNTRHYTDKANSIVVQQTRNYTITLKPTADASGIYLSEIDPFIISPYSGVNFEIHTYPYKFEEVYWQFMGDDKRAYDDHLAWALLIPNGRFRYSLEEIPIGTYRNGELFGAYSKYQHSFGEWGRNHEACTDWWQNPTTSLVY